MPGSGAAHLRGVQPCQPGGAHPSAAPLEGRGPVHDGHRQLGAPRVRAQRGGDAEVAGLEARGGLRQSRAKGRKQGLERAEWWIHSSCGGSCRQQQAHRTNRAHCSGSGSNWCRLRSVFRRASGAMQGGGVPAARPHLQQPLKRDARRREVCQHLEHGAACGGQGRSTGGAARSLHLRGAHELGARPPRPVPAPAVPHLTLTSVVLVQVIPALGAGKVGQPLHLQLLARKVVQHLRRHTWGGGGCCWVAPTTHQSSSRSRACSV